MTPKIITIHCSANSNGSLITGEDIRRFHKAPAPKGRGWADIGYHGVIECDGGYFQGRPDDMIGAHVAGHNTGNLGICLVGHDKFTKLQFDTLRWWMRTKMAAYNIPIDKVFCHYQWDTAKKQGKTCPNIPVEIIRRWYTLENDQVLEPYLLKPKDEASGNTTGKIV
jgi:N-acetylmuramoyl-L-alanine amidase